MARRLNHNTAKAAVISESFKKAEAATLLREHENGQSKNVSETVPSPSSYYGLYRERLRDGSTSVYLKYLNAPIPGHNVSEHRYLQIGYEPPFETLPWREEYMSKLARGK